MKEPTSPPIASRCEPLPSGGTPVARDHMVAALTGPRSADILAPAGAWHLLGCGNGTKGRHWYDWALFATARPEISLLVRRPVTRPSEPAR